MGGVKSWGKCASFLPRDGILYNYRSCLEGPPQCSSSLIPETPFFFSFPVDQRAILASSVASLLVTNTVLFP